MRKRTYIVYGYGVDNTVLNKITTMQLVEFLKKHLPKDYEYMMADLADETESPTETDYEQWLDGGSCINSGIEGKYSIISTVISEETGIRVQYENSSDFNISGIILKETLPWVFSAKECLCTKEELDAIFKKYFAEFGLNVEPKRIEIEYYG